jgi:hypothetical protein
MCCDANMLSRILAFAYGASLCGCWSVGFVSTDPGAIKHSSAKPSFYVDERPREPYRPIGYVWVESDPIVSESKIRAIAEAEGARAGCHVLVDRRLLAGAMSNLRLIFGSTVFLAHNEGTSERAPASASGGTGTSSGSSTRDNSAAGAGARSSGSNAWARREFVCGVLESQSPN